MSVLKSAGLALFASFPFLALPLAAQSQAQSEPQDVSTLRKAAEQGDAQKQFELGRRYDAGKGTAKDHAEAMKWYCKAAEQGDPGKQFQVGFMYWIDGNNVEATKWYRKAGEQGHLLAQADLGSMYEAGRGVPQDYVEAAKWYRRAAENDTVEKTALVPTKATSQDSLGRLYENGLGVPQDDAEAAKWYRKAVGSGDDRAVFSIYFLCSSGKTTRDDCADTAKWLLVLANQDDSVLLPSVRAIQGSNVAQYFLGTLYSMGLGVQQDYTEAARWYRKAADQGNVTAQFQSMLTVTPPTMCWLTSSPILKSLYSQS